MTIRHDPHLKGKVFLSSLEKHISREYTDSVVQKMKETNDHPGLEHARLRDINPIWFETLKPFAIIRNPWDRVASRYFFAKKVIEVEKKVPESYADVSSFEAFLEERHKWGHVPYMWHRAVRGWYPAFEHVCDSSGRFSTEKIDILRFENYTEDYQRYFGLLNEPKARNVTALNKGTYQDIYTKETIQIVADWYTKDIETWGYDFDTGPTRNTWAI